MQEGALVLLTILYPPKQLLIPRRLLQFVLGSLFISTLLFGILGWLYNVMTPLYVGMGVHALTWLALVPFSFIDPYLFHTLRRKLFRRSTKGRIIPYCLSATRDLEFYGH
ncbi:hypothetical protein COO20_21455 [Thalassospira marina]|jgi:hypothetical protein|uniref:Uncharacterized protein n=1 Tax=Thalassospira marina TaxID=2048283 RepID=A0A2N3KIR0_9PROT|nr:hypothetical protein THS27_21640 [Thalassospira sp. MCCC 1A01428]PKR50442.1 hypothetical protein COO20_21455 [Thalassospira marina]